MSCLLQTRPTRQIQSRTTDDLRRIHRRRPRSLARSRPLAHLFYACSPPIHCAHSHSPSTLLAHWSHPDSPCSAASIAQPHKKKQDFSQAAGPDPPRGGCPAGPFRCLLTSTLDYACIPSVPPHHTLPTARQARAPIETPQSTQNTTTHRQHIHSAC